MSKLDVYKHISVKVTMDELNLTYTESKATYKQIKEYIYGNKGQKVASLSIVQSKGKYRIIERENYYKSKKIMLEYQIVQKYNCFKMFLVDINYIELYYERDIKIMTKGDRERNLSSFFYCHL